MEVVILLIIIGVIVGAWFLLRGKQVSLFSLEKRKYHVPEQLISFEREPGGLDPTTLRDPSRAIDYTGPIYGNIDEYVDGVRIYDAQHRGPVPGEMMNVPVPMGAMKDTSEKYKRPFAMRAVGQQSIPLTRGGTPLIYPARGPYYGVRGGQTFPDQMRPIGSANFFKPYGPNDTLENIPFYSKVDSFHPFPEVMTDYEKIGLFVRESKCQRNDLDCEEGNSEILNAYRRPIAPLQDLFEYMAQDKNGFIIKLHEKYLNNGDIVPRIIGKGGPFRLHAFEQNKWIWQ